MPEYLAPGVFVEETSFRQKTIEGVSTSTTGFIGPARFGPVDGEPALLTSFSDFERIYGGIDQLEFEVGNRTHNYLAHAVRAYFQEGGKRLYVARIFKAKSAGDKGIAEWDPQVSPREFGIKARYPGAAGNVAVTFSFRLGPNILDSSGPEPTLRGAPNYETVLVTANSGLSNDIYWVNHYIDQSTGRRAVRLRRDDGAADQEPPGDSPATHINLDNLTSVRRLTVSVTVAPMGRFGEEQVWEGLTFHPARRDSLSRVFDPEPTSRRTLLYVPVVFISDTLKNGATIAGTLIRQESLLQQSGSPSMVTVETGLADSALSDLSRTFQVILENGNDGDTPTATEYEGDADKKSGLRAFEDLEDISIVAAPGSTAAEDLGKSVMRHLISHCERMKYRVAILDSVINQTPGEVREIRGTVDSKMAALYYPWVRIYDPVTETDMFNPPSGHLAGIYARNDIETGVHKSPANETIRLARGYEFLINKAQQEVLNPEGINCLRFFEGRGYRVWGARTVTSDPEWKYLNVRRYFAFLERSIERGTQWVVFENNGPVLWSNVRRTIEDFLFNEWKENHLLGTKPEEAYFVRCDRTTMTQNDLDNGRLICLIGVAPLKPAEFVIFRIGQKTADSSS